MRPNRVHPIAIVTFACLTWAFVSCLRIPNPVQAVHVVATSILVSPLALLLWAHLRLATGWRQNAWLAFCAAPLAYMSSFAAFLAAWFKPGWPGVLVFGAVLFALAALGVLPLRRRGGGVGAG